MINNDSSSVGNRILRPDKPVSQPATRDTASSVETPASGDAETVAVTSSVPPAEAASPIAPVDSNERNKSEAIVEVRDEAQVLNDEQKSKVTEAIIKVEEFMQDNQRTLNFEMAEKDNRVIITVIDQETKEVIRQIPPDDLVRMSDAIKNGDSLASGGILIQSKA